jgi:hypothetical protein
MTSTSNGNKHTVFPRKSDASDYIGGADTASNDRRPSVDHRIRNRSGSVIALLAGTE